MTKTIILVNKSINVEFPKFPAVLSPQSNSRGRSCFVQKKRKRKQKTDRSCISTTENSAPEPKKAWEENQLQLQLIPILALSAAFDKYSDTTAENGVFVHIKIPHIYLLGYEILFGMH